MQVNPTNDFRIITLITMHTHIIFTSNQDIVIINNVIIIIVIY